MQLTVRVPDEYKKKIDILSENMGLKKSDIARLALRKFIDENLKEEMETPYQKVRDLGQNHREYLIKKITKAGK